MRIGEGTVGKDWMVPSSPVVAVASMLGVPTAEVLLTVSHCIRSVRMRGGGRFGVPGHPCSVVLYGTATSTCALVPSLCEVYSVATFCVYDERMPCITHPRDACNVRYSNARQLGQQNGSAFRRYHLAARHVLQMVLAFIKGNPVGVEAGRGLLRHVGMRTSPLWTSTGRLVELPLMKEYVFTRLRWLDNWSDSVDGSYVEALENVDRKRHGKANANRQGTYRGDASRDSSDDSDSSCAWSASDVSSVSSFSMSASYLTVTGSLASLSSPTRNRPTSDDSSATKVDGGGAIWSRAKGGGTERSAALCGDVLLMVHGDPNGLGYDMVPVKEFYQSSMKYRVAPCWHSLADAKLEMDLKWHGFDEHRDSRYGPCVKDANWFVGSVSDPFMLPIIDARTWIGEAMMGNDAGLVENPFHAGSSFWKLEWRDGGKWVQANEIPCENDILGEQAVTEGEVEGHRVEPCGRGAVMMSVVSRDGVLGEGHCGMCGEQVIANGRIFVAGDVAIVDSVPVHQTLPFPLSVVRSAFRDLVVVVTDPTQELWVRREGLQVLGDGWMTLWHGVAASMRQCAVSALCGGVPIMGCGPDANDEYYGHKTCGSELGELYGQLDVAFEHGIVRGDAREGAPISASGFHRRALPAGERVSLWRYVMDTCIGFSVGCVLVRRLVAMCFSVVDLKLAVDQPESSGSISSLAKGEGYGSAYQLGARLPYESSLYVGRFGRGSQRMGQDRRSHPGRGGCNQEGAHFVTLEEMDHPFGVYASRRPLFAEACVEECRSFARVCGTLLSTVLVRTPTALAHYWEWVRSLPVRVVDADAAFVRSMLGILCGVSVDLHHAPLVARIPSTHAAPNVMSSSEYREFVQGVPHQNAHYLRRDVAVAVLGRLEENRRQGKGYGGAHVSHNQKGEKSRKGVRKKENKRKRNEAGGDAARCQGADATPSARRAHVAHKQPRVHRVDCGAARLGFHAAVMIESLTQYAKRSVRDFSSKGALTSAYHSYLQWRMDNIDVFTPDPSGLCDVLGSGKAGAVRKQCSKVAVNIMNRAVLVCAQFFMQYARSLLF